jgi:MFS family permease
LADAGAVRPASGRLLVAFVVGQVGLHSAMAGLRMAAPLQALREGYSAWSVGLLLALFAAAPVLLALPAGRMADRHGYHRPVRWAVALSAAGVGLAWVATWIEGAGHFAGLCVAAALTGAGANTGMIAIQRTAGRQARDATERVRIFSWLGVAPSFANVLGPVAAGLLIDAGGFRAAYLFLLALPLASLGVMRLVPAEPRREAASRSDGPAWNLLREPGMGRLMLVNWMVSMCWDVHTFAVPILGHERGFSASTIGFVLGSFTLSVSAVRLVIPALAHRLDEVGVVTVAMLGTAVVFAAYPLASTPMLMGVCSVLLGITLGSVQPMILSTLHRLTPEHRHGEALAVRSMTINACSTLMPLVFGAAGAVTGAGLLFWAVGAAVGAGTWFARGLRAPAG